MDHALRRDWDSAGPFHPQMACDGGTKSSFSRFHWFQDTRGHHGGRGALQHGNGACVYFGDAEVHHEAP